LAGVGIFVNLYQWHLQSKEMRMLDARREQLEAIKMGLEQVKHWLNEGVERKCAIKTKAAEEWVAATGNLIQPILNHVNLMLGLLIVSPSLPPPSRWQRFLGRIFPLLRRDPR